MITKTIRKSRLSAVITYCAETNSELGRLDIETVEGLTEEQLKAGNHHVKTAVRGPPQNVHGAVRRAVMYVRRANLDVSAALVRALLETGRDSEGIAAFTGADLTAVEEVVGEFVGTTDPLRWAATAGHTEWPLEYVQETHRVVNRHQDGQLEVPYVVEHEIGGPSGTVSITRPFTVNRESLWAHQPPEGGIELSATSEATWDRDGACINRATDTERWTVSTSCLTDLETFQQQVASAIDPVSTYAAVVNTSLDVPLYPAQKDGFIVAASDEQDQHHEANPYHP